MHSINPFFHHTDMEAFPEWAATSSSISNYFEHTLPATTNIYQTIHLPLYQKMSSKGYAETPAFFDTYCLNFEPLKGFDLQEAQHQSSTNVLLTAAALSYLSIKIFEQESRSFKFIQEKVNDPIIKPMIRWIRQHPIYQTPLLLKVIENHKKWLPYQRENTLIPASDGQQIPHSETSQAKASAFLLRLPKYPPLPDEHPPLDTDKQKWIAQHPSLDQKTAKRFTKNITYISYDKFLERLQASIDSFKKAIQNEPYIIVVPAESSRKSNFWVASLAQKYLQDTSLTQILKDTQLPDYLAQHENIHNLVCLDDASYSGQQMEDFIQEIKNANAKYSNLKFYLIIPFMAKAAEEKLKHYWISDRLKMYCLSELFRSQDEALVRKNATEATSRTPPGSLALTYFAHKIADVWSVHASLIYGTPLGTPEREWSTPPKGKTARLLPQFTPPYKY